MSLIGRRPGFTLVELIVVLAIIALCTMVVTIDGSSFLRREIAPPDVIDGLRRAALASGRDTTAIIARSGRPLLVTAMRDGSVVTDSVFANPEPRERQ